MDSNHYPYQNTSQNNTPPQWPAPQQTPAQPALAPQPYGAAAAPPVTQGAGSPPGANGGKRRRRRRGSSLGSVAMVVVLALLCGLLLTIVLGVRWLITPASPQTSPPSGSFSVIQVVGTIQYAAAGTLGINEPSYQHSDTVAYVNQLAEDGGNNGILLYMDTPGGGVFESDELYTALMSYKERTGRPVWAYMNTTCASGGYYICAAADRIIAHPNALTGSIGVYIALVDTSVMYTEMGVRTVLVRSGENKAVGTEGVPITDEQTAVYQSIVDESYASFLKVVMEGRGLDEATARKLGDGRPYTAKQALGHKLVDELGTFEQALESFTEEAGGTAYLPGFSTQTPLGGMLEGLTASMPKGDVEAGLDAANTLPTGVPLAYAPGLA